MSDIHNNRWRNIYGSVIPTGSLSNGYIFTFKITLAYLVVQANSFAAFAA